MAKQYKLLDKSGKIYPSKEKGTVGGHKGSKIYGKLNCPSALTYITKGQYISQRVFFKDMKTAKQAGYRPCGVCMKKEYLKFKEKKIEKEIERIC